MTLSLPTADAIPDQIGRYTLLSRLAIGGMAELFLARVQGLEGFEKVVVLKRILPHLVTDEDFVRMFLTEARLAARLDHPNVVHVHDIGREDGEYFFTMEYLHGEDLRRLLSGVRDQGMRLPLRHALSIVTQVAAGLHFAHEQVGFDGEPLGIVHRDVSPSNVIVTYPGAVKVVDFGIAKAAGPTHASRLSSLKGKASYMSPEQCKARPLDRRSDVFSIGLLLFELVTGAPAFVAGNDLAVLNRVARADVPDPRMVWPACPDALREIIERAVAARPEDRYPTALAMQLDLEAFAHESRVPLSSAALGQFMLEVFGERPLPWLVDERKPDATPVPVREATAATRAKPMPMALDVARLEETFVVPSPREETVVAEIPADPETQPAHRINPSGGTEKVHRDALPGARPVAPVAPMAEASASGRGRRWIGFVAVAVVLAGGAAAFTLMDSSEAPVEARESVPEARPEPQPVATPTAKQAEAELAVAEPEPAAEPEPEPEPEATQGEPEPELQLDEHPEPEPPRVESKPRSSPRPKSSPKSPPKSSPKAKPPTKPTPPVDGPKHSRPNAPANDDPDGLLPY